MLSTHVTSEGLYIGLERPGPILAPVEAHRFYPWPLLRSMGYTVSQEYDSITLSQLLREIKHV